MVKQETGGLWCSISEPSRLLEELAGDAVKASRCALEATLRALLTPFPRPIAGRTQATQVMVLAGKSDALLGPPVQRQIAATYPGSCPIELDRAHEFLIEVPGETAERVTRFVKALPRGRP